MIYSCANQSTLFVLFDRLRNQIPDCSKLSDTELSSLFNSIDPMPKQKLLGIIFQNLGISTIPVLLQHRKDEKRLEIKTNMSKHDRILHQKAFDKVFTLRIMQELKDLEKDASSVVNFLTQKHPFAKLVDILLDHAIASKMKRNHADFGMDTNEREMDPVKMEPTVFDQKVAKKSMQKAIVNSPVPKGESRERMADRIKELEQENEALRKENAQLLEISQLYQSFVKEGKDSSSTKQKLNDFESRKFLLLSSQIVQLKRQIDIYKDQQVENDAFVYTAQDLLIEVKTRIGNIKSKQSEKELAELSKRIDLVKKQLDRGLRDRIKTREEEQSPTYHFTSEFISQPRTKDRGSVTLLDISNGDLSHINLKHVARLEIQLCHLAKLIQQSSSALTVSRSFYPKNHDLKVLDDTLCQLLKCMDMLLSLSCLLPVAPVPELEKFRDLGQPLIPTTKQFLDALKLPAATKDRVSELIERFLGAVELDRKITHNKMLGLESELEYHKSIYDKYNDSISKVVTDLEQTHIKMLQEAKKIYEPIEQIVGSFETLEWEQDKVASFLSNLENLLKETLQKLNSFSKLKINPI